MTTKVLVLYYSSYGHVETMAREVARGAAEVRGVEVMVKRVPELVPDDIARKAGIHLEQEAPVARPGELADYDAILFGTPTRFGMMAAQMRNFLDQTGGLWARGALIGKIGSAFTSTGSQHAGQETTLLSFHVTMMHYGMVVVGLPFSAPGLSIIDEVSGGTPYGASTIAGADGRRTPSENERALARFQGRHVAELARRLAVKEVGHVDAALVA